MVRLFFLIGLPGSGKSTLATDLLNECSDRTLISTDGIRLTLYGDEAIQGDWLTIWQEVERLFRVTASQIRRGERSDAIYDATNAVRQQRREAIALARKSGFTHITGIWLNTPLWLCLQRNQQRDRQVPADVIQRMNHRLRGAPPSRLEGFNDLIRVRDSAGSGGR
ncbi:AAA family ATPase [Phormidium sp. CLA17]|uniref:AAA family ATPase n=1 Tax=Leptolyngbya sp. Cla-17 TaxID=2803751 RepID=UPI0014913AE1|nr:AAA family ATPase [Leptolyngbya sp. Cla-17]MBM0741993.1 AAA family ATPase [Leptolyngbya sp. Cla-17]